MIIVVGSPVVGPDTLRPGRRAAGLAVGIALAAREAGARVELVGKVGDDQDGDALAVELERDGVGHAALLRDPASSTPHAGRGSAAGLPPSRPDVELALRYLTEARVIVSVEQTDAAVAQAVSESAAFSGSHLVVVDGPNAGSARAADVSDDDVTRLAAPRHDDGAFAAVVGDYAAALDRGERPNVAFQRAVDDIGWEPADG